MHKINIKFNLWQTVGPIATSALVALILLALAPSLTMLNPVNALSCGTEDCQEGYTSTYANMELGAAVASVVSVGLDSNVEIDITPKSSGSFASATAALTVATNNETGFAVYMKSSNDGALVSTNGNNGSESAASIKPMVGNDFENSTNTNAWGYSLDGTSYQAVPSDSSITPIIKESSVNITSGNEYDLTFGVNVDTTLPAGYYSGTVTVSAVANPITISSLSQLVYMQDMTHDICANTADYVDLDHYITKQLIDTRDGKKYWVAKLADGNCWMVQNLALDITEAMASATGNSGLLNSNTTDIGYDSNGNLIDGIKYWNADSEYPPEETLHRFPYQNEYEYGNSNAVFSFNLGRWVTGAPVLVSACTVKSSNSSLSVCEPAGAVDVGDGEWRPSFTAQIMEWTGSQILQEQSDYTESNSPIPLETYNGYVAVDFNRRVYDSHYLIGNYYLHNAITAGTGGSGSPVDAPDSLCPKGWKLPKGTDKTSSYIPGSYGYLLRQYAKDGGSSLSRLQSVSAPLYLLASGNITDINGNSMLYYGFGNYLQSATSSIGNPSKILSLGAIWGDGGGFMDEYDNGDPNITGTLSKTVGVNARCLAR